MTTPSTDLKDLEPDLLPIKQQLIRLADKYRDGNQHHQRGGVEADSKSTENRTLGEGNGITRTADC